MLYILVKVTPELHDKCYFVSCRQTLNHNKNEAQNETLVYLKATHRLILDSLHKTKTH